MKKLLIAAGVLAITCSTQAFAQENNVPNKNMSCPIEAKSQQPQHCKRIPPKCVVEKFEEELSLTEKQKEQAKQLREKQKEAAKPLFEELKVKEQEAQALRQQLKELRLQGKKDFEAILTEKQLKKLEEIKAERKQKFGKRHHRGSFHRRPPMPPECRSKQQTPSEKE